LNTGTSVRVLYFAWVREKAGLAAEEVTPPENVTDVAGLVTWLRARGGGSAEALADLSLLRIAVNREHARIDHPVGRDDEIAFFPPITGG
jgi:molybdopterin synthase sulfur carrier subunit